MIINFSLENWMSFRDRVTFSMVATSERQHGDRVPKLGKYQLRVLPITAIFGGNASGKTNFFKALSFAKELVVKGAQPDSLIPVEPFRLDDKMADQPSRFCFNLLIDERIYEFSFAVTHKAVLEEKLTLVTSSSEKDLYHRRDGKLNFDGSLAKDQFLQFAFNGTRDNQLFLTNSVSQKVDNFRPIYDWFKDTLELLAPDSRFGFFEKFLDEGHPFYSAMNDILPLIDIGAKRLGAEEIPFENIPLPESLKSKLREEVKEGMTVRPLTESINERFVVTRKDGELIAKKLVTYHPKEDGAEVKFEIRQESDGSRRVIDLLPALFELSNQLSKKVYVIDDVDRYLHPLMSRKFLEKYLLYRSKETRTQLLLSAHDASLIDQWLFRRDEMWVAERNGAGASSLHAFSDYIDSQRDKDIRASYLLGRMGGIPHIFFGAVGVLANPHLDEESEGDD
ncbi:MAG: ATP-binding protein [Deltaproteobacteria bacterium]|jgi:AAA15 family ATPase/GTPase|nr:ATP-binding protein [Deltaproteobacteria bacterium]